LAYGLRHQGTYPDALVIQQELLAWNRKNYGPTHPDTFNAMRESARLLARLGRRDEAREMIDDEIAILPAEEWAEREILAWQFATYPLDALRDGELAVKLATEACEITKFKQSSPVDTLAGAYAEAGDFTSAIKWQRKAIELTNEPVSRARYTRHLKSYENDKPWRDEP
jgi:tetratricopeptide (TPR) repeat protein